MGDTVPVLTAPYELSNIQRRRSNGAVLIIGPNNMNMKTVRKRKKGQEKLLCVVYAQTMTENTKNEPEEAIGRDEQEKIKCGDVRSFFSSDIVMMNMIHA